MHAIIAGCNSFITMHAIIPTTSNGAAVCLELLGLSPRCSLDVMGMWVRVTAYNATGERRSPHVYMGVKGR